MSKTSCTARMKLADTTAILDAVPSTSDNQNFGSLSFLAGSDAVDLPPYGTTEKNQFVLDGSHPIMPDELENVTFWSLEKTDDNCEFQKLPKIEITFSKNHSSAGITLYFSDDYPAEISVTWYALTGEKLVKKSFFPDSLTYYCKNQVQNYGKIVVEFVRTRFPDRYIKLQYILYGRYLIWSDSEVMTAKIHEEVDETSDTLAINTAEIKISDEAYDFDISNPDGEWKSVQAEQPVWISESVDGVEIDLGTFFVSGQTFSENSSKFSLIDTVGLMDRYTFREGRVYSEEKAGDIMKEIFAAAGVDKYEIAPELYDVLLTGHLEIQTCRDALKTVCFAIGALADDSRSDTVKVYKPTRYVSSQIGPDRKISGKTSLELDEYISGISIECNTYTLGTEEQELYNDELPTGISTIELSSPCAPESIAVSGGALKSAKTNYVKIQMDTAGVCVIKGKTYEKDSFSASLHQTILEGGEKGNVKEYASVPIHSKAVLPEKLESLLSYYQLRKKLSMQFFVETEKVGNWVNIRDVKGNVATTALLSQDIDLTGGYIATASCKGYSVVTTDYFFTGQELIAGEGGVI